MANSGDIRGKSSRCGVFGDTWQLGKNPGGEVFRSALGTRGGFRGRFEEGFRRDSRQGFGDISHFRKSLSAQPSGHVARSEGRTEGFGSKACRKGLSEKWLRADFRDRWHSPKGGPAGASAESSKGGLRQGFGKISKGSEGGSSKGFPRGASGLVLEGGFRRELRRVAFRAGYHR